jgi:hypothetical protein
MVLSMVEGATLLLPGGDGSYRVDTGSVIGRGLNVYRFAAAPCSVRLQGGCFRWDIPKTLISTFHTCVFSRLNLEGCVYAPY